VEGHTCSIGPEAYNQGLSERRAASVADFLVSEGIRPDAIRQVGFGEDRPVADNATRAGREQNRRVEITTDVRKRVQ
jgi:OOP family OmpA-OmpF porin